MGHGPGRRLRWAAFVFVNGFITIALLALLAMISRTPFVFPSLGPTAFMLFATPQATAASPRHTLIGHAIGILCGYGALLVCGLSSAPDVQVMGVNGARVLAAALSLAACGALMLLFRAVHPPAGATTLIVALGIVHRPMHLLTIEVAVAILVAQAIVINRIAHVPYPWWAPPRVETSPVSDEGEVS